jgi:hypothetical protein
MLSKALPTSRVPEGATPPEAKAVDPVPERAAHYRPGREGKSNVTGYFPPAVKKQLRLLAAQQETTIQALLAEALNDLFAKNGKPEIAPRDH